MSTIDQRDRFRGSLLGLAVGDALGAAVEFEPPGTFEPVYDMRGGGPYRLNPGEWTDDTSMALCLAVSLLKKKGFDAFDQHNRYWRWYKEGYLSSTGECFDIGMTVRNALIETHETGQPYSSETGRDRAGNGSLMRLAPIPMFYEQDLLVAKKYAALSSKTTHGAPQAVDACVVYTEMIIQALQGRSKHDILNTDAAKLDHTVRKVVEGSYRRKSVDEIIGSGYVVHSLETALWGFATTDDFSSGLLNVVNRGDDSDTTGAIYGQLAGAYYGMSQIPRDWLEKIARYDMILQIADDLYDQRPRI